MIDYQTMLDAAKAESEALYAKFREMEAANADAAKAVNDAGSTWCASLRKIEALEEILKNLKSE